jgi:hypothetical protein
MEGGDADDHESKKKRAPHWNEVAQLTDSRSKSEFNKRDHVNKLNNGSGNGFGMASPLQPSQLEQKFGCSTGTR